MRARGMTPAQQQAARVNLAKSKGQPTKYREKFVQMLIDYFDKNPNKAVGKKRVAIDFPTLQGFARKIKVDAGTLDDWAKAHPEFAAAKAFAQTCQANTLIVNAMHGFYMQPWSILFAKNNMGWKDAIAHTGGDGGPIEHDVTLNVEIDRRRAVLKEKMQRRLGVAS